MEQTADNTATARDREGSTDSLNILVVDDSKTARFAMRKYLEHLHYTVVTACDAAEAYAYLDLHTPDVIFLDNIMPGINGMEVLSRLQHNAKTKVIPVIFCTSINNNEFIANALEHGARRVLHKPPTIDGLSELLAHLGERQSPQEAANMPFSGTGEVEQRSTYNQIQQQIDAAVQRLKQELAVQLSELQSQLMAIDTNELTPDEIKAFRKIAREEAESLNAALRAEMDAIHRRLDKIALRQLQTMQQVMKEKPV